MLMGSGFWMKSFEKVGVQSENGFVSKESEIEVYVLEIRLFLGRWDIVRQNYVYIYVVWGSSHLN